MKLYLITNQHKHYFQGFFSGEPQFSPYKGVIFSSIDDAESSLHDLMRFNHYTCNILTLTL